MVVDPAGSYLPGFSQTVLEQVTDTSLSWGYSVLERQHDPETGELKSDTSLNPSIQIPPAIYLGPAFTGAQCAVFSIDFGNEVCGEFGAAYFVDFHSLREYLAAGAELDTEFFFSAIVNDSACAGGTPDFPVANCTNQAFPLNSSLSYVMLVINSLPEACTFTFKVDAFSDATCDSTFGTQSSEPQPFGPSAGPAVPQGPIPGLTYAQWFLVNGTFLVDQTPPGKNYHLVIFPYESVENGTARPQVFHLAQAFTSEDKCAALEQATNSAESPKPNPSLAALIGASASDAAGGIATQPLDTSAPYAVASGPNSALSDSPGAPP
ncbi:hypothetical protein WJX73_001555 [Symbiochloris irregularis]|uniref:Uncharacterized protein n=1 Tax=Symbiochloris irregularis TaxID=706552 RepID=A0AAW1NYZ7_9CHLO